MRTRHDGPVTIAQDLSTFDVPADAVVVRQTHSGPVESPVVCPTEQAGPPMSPPNDPAAWWSDVLITK